MKMIVLFDEKVGITPIEHNIKDEDADKEVIKLRKEAKLPAFHLRQVRRHKETDGECPLCTKEITRFFKEKKLFSLKKAIKRREAK